MTQTRRELFGGTPGSVEARAVFSVQTPNRFEESSVPVIEVDAVSTDRGNAVTLADDTVAAFASWIEGQQETANVPEDDRILIKPLTAAHVVSQVGGPSYGIPVLLAAAVLLAFGGAAFVVDSLTRRQRQTAGARNSASTSGRASRRRGEARSSA